MNLPNTFQQFFDNSGRPLSNGKLYSYTAGSTNLPKPLYSDFELTTERANPVILDASGRPGVSYMTSGGYNLVLKDSVDILIEQWDYQNGTGSSTSGTSDSFKVKTDPYDTPDYLVDKVVSSDGIDVVLYTGTTRKLEIKSKGQSKVNAGDALGYLNQKFADTSSIKWSEVANKMTANVEVSAISATIPGDRKTVVDSDDLDAPGYLADKIVAGSGPVTVTVEESGLHKQLHINVFGPGDVGTNGYCPTMDSAAATDTSMPNLNGARCELVTIFNPRADFSVDSNTKLGCAMLQGASGILILTIRDQSYNLIAYTVTINNPTSNTLLESPIAWIQNPTTFQQLTSYKLVAGTPYYFGIHYSLNGASYWSVVGSQTTNILPAPAWKFENLTSLTNTLTGGSESLMRLFVRGVNN